MTWGSELHSCMLKMFPVSFGMQPKKVMTNILDIAHHQS